MKKQESSSKGPIIIVAIVLLMLIGGATALFWPSSPKTAKSPHGQSFTERKNYVMSGKFQSLSMDEKKKYLKAAMKSGNHRKMFKAMRDMPKEERDKLRKNMRPIFRAMMQERVEGYFNQKTPEAKQAYLDKQIDEYMKRRQTRKEQQKELTAEEKEARKKRREEWRKRGPSLDRMKERIETSDPKERAQRTQYFMALKARMQERGVSMRGPGRRH